MGGSFNLFMFKPMRDTQRPCSEEAHDYINEVEGQLTRLPMK